MPTLQEMAAEAIASAIWRMPFAEFLGERPDPVTKDNVIWFRLTEQPEVRPRDMTAEQRAKQVLLEIRQDRAFDGIVVLQVHWLNCSGPDVLRGGLALHIPTLTGDRGAVEAATAKVVERVLRIFQDVLAGTGVAGPIDQVAPPSEAGDPDDPDDMAVPGE